MKVQSQSPKCSNNFTERQVEHLGAGEEGLRIGRRVTICIWLLLFACFVVSCTSTDEQMSVNLYERGTRSRKDAWHAVSAYASLRPNLHTSLATRQFLSHCSL